MDVNESLRLLVVYAQRDKVGITQRERSSNQHLTTLALSIRPNT